MNEAFGVKLGRYQHDIVHHYDKTQTETYRGRDGFIHIPSELSEIITGVFGLDNRTITKRNSFDPHDQPNTTPLTVPQVSKLYNYPTNSAVGQTIGIFAVTGAGYHIQDIQLYFDGLPTGYTMPKVNDILVHGTNLDISSETTQDICIAAAFAPGSTINVYFTKDDQQGWIDLIKRVIHPNAGDIPCSVLSCSFYISNGDDENEGVSSDFINEVSSVFHDAAIMGHITICIASGDTGTDSKVGDGKAHVQYPASDPWVLSVGGTTVGNVKGALFDEYVWNDVFYVDQTGATGGGVSDFFGLPTYQNGAGVPRSINDNHIGRGVPDVAGNASPNSEYFGLFFKGTPSEDTGNGTSASAPQWAGLIAVINAALGKNVGFVNPYIYSLGSSVFRDINPPPGPADNSCRGVKGYPAGLGWDACTGWGSPNGTALLEGLRNRMTV